MTGDDQTLSKLAQAQRLLQEGRAQEAERECLSLLEHAPQRVEIHILVGAACLAQTQPARALASFMRGIVLDPSNTHAHNGLGASAVALSSPRADAAFLRAESLDPASPVPLGNRLVLAQRRADGKAAWKMLARALRRHPDHPAFLRQVVETAVRDGRSALDARLPSAAARYFQIAVSAAPDAAEVFLNLGVASLELGTFDAALAAFRRAIALRRDYANAEANYGNALWRLGRLLSGRRHLHRAIAIEPALMAALNGLGTVLKDLAEPAPAVVLFKRALAVRPDYQGAYSNLLHALSFDPDVGPQSLLDAHTTWAAWFRSRHPVRHTTLSNTPDPGRKLRVGYVSADFGRHPVGYFLGRLLRAHDRRHFEIVCYSDRVIEDHVTRELRTHVSSWHSVAALPDDELARRIAEYRIDILVDLAGHTAGNRLPTFARKPAPIQVTWAGYVGTTGLAEIDGLITDGVETPPGDEDFLVETPMRMPRCYVTYLAPGDAPAVAGLPAGKAGHVTFGSFNNLAKINERVIALWARVLEAVPGSRLRLRWRSLDDPGVIDHVRARFAAHGASGDRIDLLGGITNLRLLADYAAVDIALDPFPYSGGLTTLEAMWMGVPVVTLPGTTFASRHSASHLSAAGLRDWIVRTQDDYVALAANKAADLPTLTRLREGLRPRLLKSPLCDGPAFAEALETAYRRLWRRWCRERRAKPAL